MAELSLIFSKTNYQPKLWISSPLKSSQELFAVCYAFSDSDSYIQPVLLISSHWHGICSNLSVQMINLLGMLHSIGPSHNTSCPWLPVYTLWIFLLPFWLVLLCPLCWLISSLPLNGENFPSLLTLAISLSNSSAFPDLSAIYTHTYMNNPDICPVHIIS